MTTSADAEAERERLARQNTSLSAANADLRHANEALVFAGARYLALHDLAPTPLVTVDADGLISEVNYAAAALLGRARAQLLAQPLATFVIDPPAPELARQLHALFATGAAADVALTVLRGDAPVELLVTAVVLPNGSLPHAVLACVDITARKLDEAVRERAIRHTGEAQRLESLGVLAGGIAHDFNNLMTVVLAGTDLVLHDLSGASPHVVPLREVRAAARHAGELAHQMLAYSGRVSAPHQPVDLAALVRELEPLIRATAWSTPLVFELSERLPAIAGDAPQLRQVVLNLVTNAAEAMDGHPGAITIVVRRDARTEDILIEVRDVGAGMTAATQTRIFEPYFSTKLAGRGLGLAVVHGVVRAHGGTLHVDSAVGVGTTVQVALRAVVRTAVLPGAHVDLAWRGRGRVLLVDDDVAVRRTLGRVLGGLGLTVVMASSAQEGLTVLTEAPRGIDLVVTDLTMPTMNGVAFARAIRSLGIAVPIVLVTGYGELPLDSARLFTASVTKPFDLAALRAVLQPLIPRADS